MKPGKDKIWVFGESGIGEELNSLGFEFLGGADERLNEPFNAETSPFLKDGLDKDVKAVIAGLDFNVNYHRIAVSLQYLLNKDISFVGTNVDSTFPHDNHIIPGAGSLIDSLACAAHRKPAYCGKPNMTMLNSIISANNLNKSRCCLVGDRLNTDIRFGVDGKLGGTMLVLSGIETEEKALEQSNEHPKPKYYVANLGKVYELLQT